MMELFDTHAHLDFARYEDDRHQVIRRAAEAGVRHIVNVGADLSSSLAGIDLAGKYDGIRAAVGVHPHEADSYDLDMAKKIRDLAERSQVVAVGETGLDYHYDNSPRPRQRQAFRSQLRLAETLQMPVIIHSREAEDDTLEILEEEWSGSSPAVVHCYSSSAGMARELVERGFYIGFTGLITFSGLDWLRRIAADTPLERILSETDSPYMSPEPERGRRNEPARVEQVVQQIAECHDIPSERAGEILLENGRRFFSMEDDSILSAEG